MRWPHRVRRPDIGPRVGASRRSRYGGWPIRANIAWERELPSLFCDAIRVPTLFTVEPMTSQTPGPPADVAAEDRRRCPVCGSRRKVLYADAGTGTGDAGGVSLDGVGPQRRSIKPGRVLRCSDCRAGYLAEPPDEAMLEAVYARMDATRYEAELAGRTRTAASHVKIVARHQPGGRLLDVGCASGDFLVACADAGFDVVGLEPSSAAVSLALEKLDGRGQVHEGMLQGSNLASASFDCVTMWDVVEHVRDPRGFLEEAASYLRPGGCLFVNVPDIDSWPARTLGDRWPLLLPEHLTYFTRDSLRRLGEACGLSWVTSGRRMAWFSIGYVFQRLAEHEIPGSKLAAAMAGRASGAVPVPLGEVYGVWRKR